MTTFADLMSLLMALFVLLFAISTVDEQKFDEFKDSMETELNSQVEKNPEEKNEDHLIQPIPELLPLYDSLLSLFSHELRKEEMEIEFKDNKIKLTFPSEGSFKTGSADLSQRFQIRLRKLRYVKEFDVFVSVIGHSDSRPLHGHPKYRNNWDLSGARASAVAVNLLEKVQIVDKQHIEAVGVADARPIVSPEVSLEDMAKNRRVDIILSENNSHLFEDEAEEAAKDSAATIDRPEVVI